jgi:transcriptional regulator with XRE-family HTH domain
VRRVGGVRRETCVEAGAVGVRSESAGDEERYLSTFVRSLRERADPHALGITLYGSRRRRGLGLRQSEMARLMGITETWYQKLESGAAPWSEQRVAAFAQILDLSAEDRFVLYRLALDWAPESVRAISGVSEVNKAAIDSITVPALLLDHVYQLRWRNKAMADLIPELTPGANWMTWILASPMARERLAQWERDWATPTLAQLRTSHAVAEPHLKPELAVLIDVVRLASPDLVARLWDHASFYLTPAGEKRRVKVGRIMVAANSEEVSVRLWTAQPELSPGWRVYTMEPIDAPTTGAQRRGRTTAAPPSQWP